MEDIQYTAVAIDRFKPKAAQIYIILLDGRLPMMAQAIPDICINDNITFKWQSIPVRNDIKKGLTHVIIPTELIKEYT